MNAIIPEGCRPRPCHEAIELWTTVVLFPYMLYRETPHLRRLTAANHPHLANEPLRFLYKRVANKAK